MPLKKLVFLVSLTLASTVRASYEAPSESDCRFYAALEDQYQCGANGYFQKFALPLCQIYLNSEPTYSVPGQAFMREVRLCLQEVFTDPPPMGCAEAKDYAMQSHVDCYKQSGYCDLSWRDTMHLARDLNKQPGARLDPAVARLATQLLFICPR